MIITKKAISRRTVLRGLGTTLALPLLDGMVPALTAAARTAAGTASRLGIVYVPNGIVMEQWTPATEGAGFELTPTLKPLARFRERMTVVTGLTNKGPDFAHETGATSFLTGVSPKRTQGADLQASVSMDQEVARALGIPDDVTQTVLLPVAYTRDAVLKPAARKPAREVTYWNRWEGRHEDD